MFSNDKKLTDFIETFSENQEVLSKLCNEEKAKISNEIENVVKEFDETKKYLIKEANELFAYSTSNFKQSSEGFKNKLELLKKDEPDYSLLKESLDLDSKTHTFSGTALKKDLGLKDKSNVYKIYRVGTTDNVAAQSQSSNNSNILLLHGTRGQNIERILKEGFRLSQDGSYGPGVYLTNSYRIASGYGNCFVNDEGVPKKVIYLFVNKVRQTDTEGPPSKLRKVTHSEESTESFLSFAKFNPSKAAYKNGKKMGPKSSSKIFKVGNSSDHVLKMLKAHPTRTPVSLEDSSQDKFDSEEN